MPQFWPPSPPRMLAGRVAGVNSLTFTTVAFPAGYFTATPRVVATVNNGGYIPIQVKNVSASSFEVAVGSGSGINVEWIAVQS